MSKNISSRSVILAPFNTTDEEEDEEQFSLKIEEKKIKFLAKVREYNRQFERNNNCDLDNGVYNKRDTSLSDEYIEGAILI